MRLVDPAVTHARQLKYYVNVGGEYSPPALCRWKQGLRTMQCVPLQKGSPPALRRWKQGLKTTHRRSEAAINVVVKSVHHRDKPGGVCRKVRMPCSDQTGHHRHKAGGVSRRLATFQNSSKTGPFCKLMLKLTRIRGRGIPESSSILSKNRGSP